MSDKQARFNTLFMKTADLSAEMSHSRRTKVGSVLVKDNRIIANSWNGRVSGADNNCEDEIDGKLVTRSDVIHAEANLLIFAARHGLATDGCVLYVTLSPCVTCALLIIQSGINRVYYRDDYRNLDGLKLLRDNGITVIKMQEV